MGAVMQAQLKQCVTSAQASLQHLSLPCSQSAAGVLFQRDCSVVPFVGNSWRHGQVAVRC